MKKYILMTIEKDLKHEGFERHHFKLFENYFELQKHLKIFWFMKKVSYKIFEETNLKKDYSLSDVKKDGLRT